VRQGTESEVRNMMDRREVQRSFGDPWTVVEPPRMSRRHGLQPGECSDVPPTQVFPAFVDQDGTPYTEHPHRLLFCPSLVTMNDDNRFKHMVQLHKEGNYLWAIHEPFTDGQMLWDERQTRAMHAGERVISFIGLRRTGCIVVWTCFSAPFVPKYRFVMNRHEFEYEHYHNFPVEKYVDSLNLKFPVGDESEQQLEESLERTRNVKFFRSPRGIYL
jgi:hypothetical protein